MQRINTFHDETESTCGANHDECPQAFLVSVVILYVKAGDDTVFITGDTQFSTCITITDKS